VLKVSERRACKTLGQYRSSQRHTPEPDDYEKCLVNRMVALATKYGRYGYKMITGLLRGEGWKVNHKRIERLWRQEGLKVPKKQPKRGRLWLNDGSCIRLRPLYKNHVWSYDFMSAHTHDGRAFRILNVLDEYSRECLGSLVARRITHQDVIDFLALLFIMKGYRNTFAPTTGLSS
jgi:putative transposase